MKIESTAVDLGKTGKDLRFGHGRIDTAAAVATLQPNKERRCTIKGTEGSDILIGTEDQNIICGLGGNDIIRGGDGNDIIYGDAGDDVMNGNSGNDRIVGATGKDVLNGHTGRDRLYGGSSRDVLNIRDGRGGELGDGGGGRDICTADPRDKVAEMPVGVSVQDCYDGYDPALALHSLRVRVQLPSRDCMERVRWVVIRYSSTHEKTLPNRPL